MSTTGRPQLPPSWRTREACRTRTTLGTVCIVFLIEMVGCIAAMSSRAYMDILREKFGFKFALLPLASELVANFLILAAEIGGAAFVLYLITGSRFRCVRCRGA